MKTEDHKSTVKSAPGDKYFSRFSQNIPTLIEQLIKICNKKQNRPISTGYIYLEIRIDKRVQKLFFFFEQGAK